MAAHRASVSLVLSAELEHSGEGPSRGEAVSLEAAWGWLHPPPRGWAHPHSKWPLSTAH